MERLFLPRSKVAPIAGVIAVLLASACAEPPTSTPELSIGPTSAPLFVTFSNTGALYFDPSSDCAFNTGTGNLDCSWTLKGLAAGDYVNFSYTAYWDISVYCESAKGKLAPARQQPESPVHTYSSGGNGPLLMNANGEYAWNNFTLYPPGLSSSYYCPRRSFNVAVFGDPQPTSWVFHAYKVGDELGTFANASDTLQ